MKVPYPWQNSQWQNLLAQCQQNLLPHALLLMGPAGLGKLDFALSFAHYILCDERSKERPCQHCRSCRLLAANNHPDLFKIYLENDSKTIKIDQLRELIDQLNATSLRGGYQVAIIYPAEAMNTASANAILKTLEEPSGKVLFLLVAQQIGNLPATIASRCQKIYFTAKEDSSTLDWLTEKVKSDTKSNLNIPLLLRLAENVPFRAIDLATNNYFDLRDQLLQHLIQIIQGKVTAIAWKWDYKNQDVSMLLCAWIALISDIVRIQLGVENDFILNSDCIEKLKTTSQLLPVLAAHEFLNSLLKAQQLVRSAIAVNVQLLIEKLFIEWETMSKNSLSRE